MSIFLFPSLCHSSDRKSVILSVRTLCWSLMAGVPMWLEWQRVVWYSCLKSLLYNIHVIIFLAASPLFLPSECGVEMRKHGLEKEYVHSFQVLASLVNVMHLSQVAAKTRVLKVTVGCLFSLICVWRGSCRGSHSRKLHVYNGDIFCVGESAIIVNQFWKITKYTTMALRTLFSDCTQH